ncbi:hypothetical protein [Azohydromonas sediminis]|uniref:hypothetical protein n=1 Tax=Azohydromonas sediminis TaxID=2259674 RepID=UPI0013C320D6|nr:hypothetical protein [Azohydromonas sediminis]
MKYSGLWSEAELACLSYLGWLGALDARALALAAKMPLGETLAALRRLQVGGFVSSLGGAWCVTGRALRAVEDAAASPQNGLTGDDHEVVATSVATCPQSAPEGGLGGLRVAGPSAPLEMRVVAAPDPR